MPTGKNGEQGMVREWQICVTQHPALGFPGEGVGAGHVCREEGCVFDSTGPAVLIQAALQQHPPPPSPYSIGRSELAHRVLETQAALSEIVHPTPSFVF